MSYVNLIDQPMVTIHLTTGQVWQGRLDDYTVDPNGHPIMIGLNLQPNTDIPQEERRVVQIPWTSVAWFESWKGDRAP